MIRQKQIMCNYSRSIFQASMGVTMFIYSCSCSRWNVAVVLEFCRRLMCSRFFPASASVNVETLLIIIHLILKFFSWSAQEWVVVSKGYWVCGGWHVPVKYMACTTTHTHTEWVARGAPGYSLLLVLINPFNHIKGKAVSFCQSLVSSGMLQMFC